MTTSAPIPQAILAALTPTVPPPMITTVAGATPAAPLSSDPLPPCGFSRQWAPACTDNLPATSLMGMSKGRERSAAVTVS